MPNHKNKISLFNRSPSEVDGILVPSAQRGFDLCLAKSTLITFRGTAFFRQLADSSSSECLGIASEHGNK